MLGKEGDGPFSQSLSQSSMRSITLPVGARSLRWAEKGDSTPPANRSRSVRYDYSHAAFPCRPRRAFVARARSDHRAPSTFPPQAPASPWCEVQRLVPWREHDCARAPHATVARGRARGRPKTGRIYHRCGTRTKPLRPTRATRSHARRPIVGQRSGRLAQFSGSEHTSGGRGIDGQLGSWQRARATLRMSAMSITIAALVTSKSSERGKPVPEPRFAEPARCLRKHALRGNHSFENLFAPDLRSSRRRRALGYVGYDLRLKRRQTHSRLCK